MIIDDRQGSIHKERTIKCSFKTLVLAINDVLLERLFNRKIGERLANLRRLGTIGEQTNEVQKRIKVFRHAFWSLRATTIKDQPLSSVPMFLGNSILRKNLARMNDGRRQSANTRLMQEDAVQNGTR